MRQYTNLLYFLYVLQVPTAVLTAFFRNIFGTYRTYVLKTNPGVRKSIPG